MRLFVVLTVLAGCLAIGSPEPAAAQGRDATPSARELWETYPLQSTPEPGAAEASPSPTPTAAAPEPAAQSSSTTLRTVVAAALAILAFGLGFVLAVRSPARRSRRRAQPSPTPNPTLKPPERGRPWSAEIEWHEATGKGCFRAVAREANGGDPTILAQSPWVQWPPSSDAGVPTLTTAMEQLERRLVAAGWRPLPPGDAWYARRFAWDPVAWSTAAAGARPRPRFRGATTTSRARR